MSMITHSSLERERVTVYGQRRLNFESGREPMGHTSFEQTSAITDRGAHTDTKIAALADLSEQRRAFVGRIAHRFTSAEAPSTTRPCGISVQCATKL